MTDAPTPGGSNAAAPAGTVAKPPDAPAGPLFRYVGGDAALDFVNTVDWTAHGLSHEKLSDYAALVRWAEGAGVVPSAEAAALRRRAQASPAEAEAALRHARSLRDTVRALFLGASRREPSNGASLSAFNAALSAAEAHVEIAPSGGGRRLVRGWRGLGERLDGVLWPVLHAAAELLTSNELDRVRQCAGDECGWLYVDRSRNGMRRWCEMETCGSRAKARRYYARRRGARGA